MLNSETINEFNLTKLRLFCIRSQHIEYFNDANLQRERILELAPYVHQFNQTFEKLEPSEKDQLPLVKKELSEWKLLFESQKLHPGLTYTLTYENIRILFETVETQAASPSKRFTVSKNGSKSPSNPIGEWINKTATETGTLEEEDLQILALCFFNHLRMPEKPEIAKLTCFFHQLATCDKNEKLRNAINQHIPAQKSPRFNFGRKSPQENIREKLDSYFNRPSLVELIDQYVKALTILNL